MKRLVALIMCAVSFGAAAQFPSLPYNPDENSDGLIGVVDLQGLLANYGSEFSGAVVSEDGENAITYMGLMAYPLCELSCRELPGFWEPPTWADLGLVWDEMSGGSGNPVWLKHNPQDAAHKVYIYRPQQYDVVEQWAGDNQACYCAARQLPRVEYSYCKGVGIQACADDLVSNGWYPLQGISSHHKNPNGQDQDYWQWEVQAFWRWAE